jgi:hypothetical protein
MTCSGRRPPGIAVLLAASNMSAYSPPREASRMELFTICAMFMRA